MISQSSWQISRKNDDRPYGCDMGRAQNPYQAASASPSAPTLLTRDEFRRRVLARDKNTCVSCGKTEDVVVHHLLERRLWPDGGYYEDNGVSLCPDCHLLAEKTLLGPDELREKAGITETLIPEGLDDEATYTKWGDIAWPDGTRSPGPLFYEEPVQKMLTSAGLLDSYIKRFKYPRTLHLQNSPNRGKDGDHAHEDFSNFEGREVVTSLKVDGEATTMARDYIHARSVEPSYHPTRTWVRRLWGEIAHDIPEGFRVVGENAYGQHSIAYKDLPTYFFVYGVYNDKNVCLSWDETEEWAELLGLQTVPVLYRGPWDKKAVMACYPRPLYSDEAEGFVVRWAEGFSYYDHWKATGKFVRENHVKPDSGHWRSGNVPVNKLAK